MYKKIHFHMFNAEWISQRMRTIQNSLLYPHNIPYTTKHTALLALLGLYIAM